MRKQMSVNREGTDIKKLKLRCGRSTHDPTQKTWCVQGREAGAPESHLGCFYFLSGLSRVIAPIPRTAFTSYIVTILCPAYASIPNLRPICVTTPGALHSAAACPFSGAPSLSYCSQGTGKACDSPLSLLLSLSTPQKWYLLLLLLFKYRFFYYYSYSNIVLIHPDLSTTTACSAKAVSSQVLSRLKPISGTRIVNMLACPYTGLPVYFSGLNTIYCPFTRVIPIFQLLKHTRVSHVSEILILKYNLTPFF